MNKLFDKESNDNGIFKDFTSIFKTEILLEKILKQSPVILKNYLIYQLLFWKDLITFLISCPS